MIDLLAKLSRGIARVLGSWASSLRKISIRCQNPGCIFEPGVAIDRGVLIRVIGSGSLRIGANTLIKSGAVIVVKDGEMAIGKNSFIGWGSVICANERVVIGDDALIAEHVTIRDQNHGTEVQGEPFHRQPMSCDPIHIEKNVWIGAKATVLKGVTVGENSVIAANAVVNKNVEANSVVGGIPAKTINQLTTGN